MKNFIIFIFLFFTSVCFAQMETFYADGPKDVKKIALTFDDGPGKSTEEILKILKEKNIKATFFMLGIRVHNDPDTANKVAAGGHEIANHTYEHINFYSYKEKDKIKKIEKELLQGESIIKQVTGIKPFLLRFPNGYSKSDAIEVARKRDYYVINWSFGCDWMKISAEGMHEKYKKALKNGAIFLMHDLSKNEKILSFLSNFIDEIKESGYEIVTISELLNFSN